MWLKILYRGKKFSCLFRIENPLIFLSPSSITVPSIIYWRERKFEPSFWRSFACRETGDFPFRGQPLKITTGEGNHGFKPENHKN